MSKKERKIFGIEPEIFILGIVSFLTDLSSEMIFSVLSIFLTVVLGASAAVLGMIEGLSDFASSSLDYISGYLSDKSGKRKIFAVFGYGFSTVAKLILVFANSIFVVGIFRVVERLGKSIRGPPRDALIASISKFGKRGFSFGFHKMLDKAGAVIGPLVAYFILSYFGSSSITFRWLFVVALIPALISVLVLIFFVKDKPAKVVNKKRENIFKSYKSLSKEFKHYLDTSALFSIAYFSFAFLLLKAYDVGFAIKDVALLYALFNIAFVLFAVPVGRLGDKIGRKWVISLEYIIYFFMCIGLMFASSRMAVFFMFILFGMFYAIDESQSKAYISDLVGTKKRATAIGLYNFITGLLYIPASFIAGWLWAGYGSAFTFAFGAFISVLALIYFLVKKR